MRQKLNFIPELESLRGLAAVSVLAFHAFDMRNETAVTGLAPVVLFFVLSGFVLARWLENNPGVRDFFVGRLFRLFPAAAACVLLLTALHWAFGFYVGFLASFDPLNVLLNAIMIRSDINGVMWSMTVECFASPLILVAFFAYRWRGPLL
jgi:exopolysaccharide production protein ExoZ